MLTLRYPSPMKLKQGIVVLVVLWGWALASGLDVGLSVRNGPGGSFMGHVGLYLDGYPVDFRSQLVFGAPQGVTINGEVIYTLPFSLVVRPYVGAGLAIGLTAYTNNPGEITLRFGDRFYALLTAGLQFPDRGYRPYLEVTQYIGSDIFTRFTAGFIAEIF